MRIFALAMSLLLAANVAMATEPHATVSISEVDPVDGTMLHSNDQVYVRIHYSADVPIKLWIRPYAFDKEVPAYTNASTVHPAGEGDALGWFECTQVCEVHSIHIQVATADSGRPFLDQPNGDYYFTWDGIPGERHSPASWVKPMQDAEAVRQKQAYDAYMAQPLGKSGVFALILFAAMLLAALFVCVVWPLYGLIKWQGKWRWLASAPLVLTVLKTLSISVDLARDPTSHNLLPFEYLIIGVIAAPYMIVVWFLRKKALKAEAE